MNKIKQVMCPLAVFVFTQTVQAQMYINGGGGGVFAANKTSSMLSSNSVLNYPTALGSSLYSLPYVNWQNDFKNGFDFNVAWGYHVNMYWRAEGEFVYQNMQRTNYGTYVWQEQYGSTGTVFATDANNRMTAQNSHADLFSLMANAAYDFDKILTWTPIASGGMGVTWLNSRSVAATNFLNATTPVEQVSPSFYGSAFTWQFKLGALHSFSDTLSMLIQYRLLGTTAFKASSSAIITNPTGKNANYFYIPPYDVKAILTQAVELNVYWDI